MLRPLFSSGSHLSAHCSMSPTSPIPPLPLPPPTLNWSLCFLLTWWFSHPYLSALQVLRRRVSLMRPPRLRWSLPRHTRPRSALLCHARPWCSLQASSSRCGYTSSVWCRLRCHPRRRRLPCDTPSPRTSTSADRPCLRCRPHRRRLRHRLHHLHSLRHRWSHTAGPHVWLPV